MKSGWRAISILALCISAPASAQSVLNIGIGSAANDGTGDPLRTALQKTMSAVNGTASKWFGPLAPTTLNSVGSVLPAMMFQDWVDQTTTPPTWRVWDGFQWVAIGTIDQVAHVFTPNLPAAATASSIGTLGGALVGILPNPSLATGAAASNLGAAAGDLTGTYPAPTVAPGAITNAKMASGAAAANVGAVGGVLSGNLPNPSFSSAFSSLNGFISGNGSGGFSASTTIPATVLTGAFTTPIRRLTYGGAVSAPLTGATVTIADTADTAVIQPAGALAALTVTLPTCSPTFDGKNARFSSTAAITALTVAASGGVVVDAPTTLAGAGAGVEYLCLGSTASWYRIQ